VRLVRLSRQRSRRFARKHQPIWLIHQSSEPLDPDSTRLESGNVTNVFLLALAASIDAVLVAAVVLLLGRPRPQRQLLSFWLGAFGLSTTIGLVIVLALRSSGLHVNQNGSASPRIEIAVGVILLAIAVAIGPGLTDRIKSKRHNRDHHQDTVPERA
jgi:hypothetical protein